MDRNSDKNQHRLIIYCLASISFVVFYQVRGFAFINYDDPAYVYENPKIQAGITLESAKWAFTTGHVNNWHPLTWLSHMLDWQLFKSNPSGHHLINLFFHIANTILIFLVLNRMTRALWPSAFVAALFALHPLHVQSVAWISERKDVLSTFFWLLTMYAYIHFVRRPRISRYLLVIVFFALGLMSKPMLVTLPFVLLILDYWPLNRLGPKFRKDESKHSLPYLLIEKVPLFAMAIASCIVTLIVQRKGEVTYEGENYGLLIRLANASISYLQYIIKMIYPARLAFYYPHPGRNVSILYAVISAVFLLTVTVIVLRLAKNHRYLVTGWFWYLGTLVPVIGLVQAGQQALADRYSYITLTGLFIIIAWGMPDLLAKWRYKKATLTLSAILIISVMTICTYFQLHYWQNGQTLFQHAIDVTEDNYLAHSHMAVFLSKQGKLDEAINHDKRALEIKPNSFMANFNLGTHLTTKGRYDEAITYYNKALQIAPDFVETRIFLGLALVYKGRFAEAVKEYEEVLRVQPQSAVAHNALGEVLLRQEKFDEAIAHFNQAVQLEPRFEEARKNLNSTLQKQKSHNKSEENANR